MSGNVIIIVAAENASFEAVAIELQKQIYPSAKIVYATTKRVGTGLQTTYVHKGKTFDWATAHKLSRVLTISHGGLDGPVFGYEMVNGQKQSLQPWGKKGADEYTGKLSAEGTAFWKQVGKNMSEDGKIIFLGCQMARAAFPGNVSGAAGAKKVYSSKEAFGAGDTRAALPAVRKVEAKP